MHYAIGNRLSIFIWCFRFSFIALGISKLCYCCCLSSVNKICFVIILRMCFSRISFFFEKEDLTSKLSLCVIDEPFLEFQTKPFEFSFIFACVAWMFHGNFWSSWHQYIQYFWLVLMLACHFDVSLLEDWYGPSTRTATHLELFPGLSRSLRSSSVHPIWPKRLWMKLINSIM